MSTVRKRKPKKDKALVELEGLAKRYASINREKLDLEAKLKSMKSDIESQMTLLGVKSVVADCVVNDVPSTVTCSIASKEVTTVDLKKLKELTTDKVFMSMLTVTKKSVIDNCGTVIKDQVLSYSEGSPSLGISTKKRH